MIGVRCPQCGLMQLPKENCESCGRNLDNSKKPLFSRRDPLPRPIPPSPNEEPPPTLLPIRNGKEESSYRRRLSFHGTGGGLFGIYLLNAFLTVITLGIYTFWGKVKVRGYLVSETEFEGDRFAYHGTGRELLIGFLKAILVFGLPLGLLNFLPKVMEPKATLHLAAVISTYAIIMVFIPVAMVGARRYRLSRTSWRGIHFSFRGSTVDFIKLFLCGAFLTAITLGLYYPVFETRRYGFMVSNSYFGNERFDFDGRGRELFKPFLFALLLTIPTLGVTWFWFLARKQRFFWEQASLDSLRFRSTVTGGGLLKLTLGNLLLLIVTLGLAWPWVMVRKIRFTLTYLSAEGRIDLTAIKQEAQDASATGEVLAGFMDAGFDLG